MHTVAWPTIEIRRFEDSLVDLQQLVDTHARTSDDDVVRQLARFLIVRSCGFIEQVSEECCRCYLQSKSEWRSAGFGSSWLGHGRNPTPGNLVALVRRFDTSWGDEFDEFLKDEDERLEREIKFLVDRRNKIAHGKSEGISARKAIDLSQNAQEVTDWLIRRIDPR